MKKLLVLSAFMLFAFIAAPQQSMAEYKEADTVQKMDPRMVYHFNRGTTGYGYTRYSGQRFATASQNVNPYAKKVEAKEMVREQTMALPGRGIYFRGGNSAMAPQADRTDFVNETSTKSRTQYHMMRCQSRFYSSRFAGTASCN